MIVEPRFRREAQIGADRAVFVRVDLPQREQKFGHPLENLCIIPFVVSLVEP